MADAIPEDKEGKAFQSVYDILVERKYPDQVGDVATAVEKVGFYTWDRYGRFIHVKPSDSEPEKAELMKSFLSELARYVEARRWASGQNEYAGYLMFLDDDYDNPFRVSGWTVSARPDFEALYNDWQAKETGGTTAISRPKYSDEPAPNSKQTYFRLIKALASMAGLELDQHHKAAEILLNHCSAPGEGKEPLPAPSKAETFGKLLKEAHDTD